MNLDPTQIAGLVVGGLVALGIIAVLIIKGLELFELRVVKIAQAALLSKDDIASIITAAVIAGVKEHDHDNQAHGAFRQMAMATIQAALGESKEFTLRQLMGYPTRADFGGYSDRIEAQVHGLRDLVMAGERQHSIDVAAIKACIAEDRAERRDDWIELRKNIAVMIGHKEP